MSQLDHRRVSVLNAISAAQQQAKDGLEFDYRPLPSSVTKFLRGQATRIRQYGSKSIVQIGKDLAGAKHYLSHGEFLRWVEREVGLPARTAQAYMRVAHWASSKGAIVALLPPTALYALSSPGVPTEIIEDVLKRAERGESIGLPALRAQLRNLRKITKVSNFSEPEGQEILEPTHHHMTFPMISKAVGILARSLTAGDFARVREIMTSEKVLDDPNLGETLRQAFGTCEPLAKEPFELQARQSLHVAVNS